MQWIHYFSIYKIPFYIYKINRGESITYTLGSHKHKYIIILHGIACIIKVFNNGETIGLGILNGQDVVNITEGKKNLRYNHVVTALKTTFLMIFELKNITHHIDARDNFLTNIIQSYNSTLYKYEMMNHILSHKSCKNRIIQLILFLSKEFAIIEKNHIIIPFSINQATLSIIIGCNKASINKIFNELYNCNAITYTYQKYICIRDPFYLSHFYNKKTKNKT